MILYADKLKEQNINGYIYIQQYIFQQMRNLIFIYDKLGLHVSAYQTIIKAPVTKNTENTAGQNK